MRALVTGGAGFIGSTLVDRLLAEGHTVDVIDDLSSGSLTNLADARGSTSGQLTFQQLDVRSRDLLAVVGRRRPDVVFHLAASAHTGGPPVDPVTDADIDIGGSLRVLEAARVAEVPKVVFASSATTIYGDVPASELPVRESQPQRPLTPSGVAKKAVTDYLIAYRESYAIEFSSLALANVYGPRQDPSAPSGVVATFAERLVAGEICAIHGDGSQTRDFVYVDDAVDALARAAGRGGGLLINVGSGIETSINALYATMAAAAGIDRPPVHVAGRRGDIRRSALDVSRAAIQLGWRPWTTLVDGTSATIDWLLGGARR